MNKPSATTTFEMNGKTYKTDVETLEVLQSIVPSARDRGDASAVATIMSLGIWTGRIKEIGHSLIGGIQHAKP